MEDVELLRVFQELHKKHFGNCSKCPLDSYNTKCKKTLCNFNNIGDNEEEVIEICEQWRKEHPVKTYADVFFEKFPNAKRYYNDPRVPNIAFADIYGGTFVDTAKDVELWLQPYPEDKK